MIKEYIIQYAKMHGNSRVSWKNSSTFWNESHALREYARVQIKYLDRQWRYVNAVVSQH